MIGLLGTKGVGKTTIARHIEDVYGYKKMSFASPLKNAVKEIFLFSDDQLYTHKKDIIDFRWNITPRSCLQYIGTDLMRDSSIVKGQNFWINRLEFELSPNTLKYVIDDVRFQNEVDYIHKKGGFVIKIDRNLCENPQFEDTHKSEIETNCIKNYNYIIRNNSTIQDAYAGIDNIILSHPYLKK